MIDRYEAGERYLADVREQGIAELREIHAHLPFAHFMDLNPTIRWGHAGVKR